jgi:hypothetical protein
MDLHLSRTEKILLSGLSVAFVILLVLGWHLFWFLTDDAFIAFRYVSNSILGYGYVWNPPPFRPVEGYTSFLWVVILDGIWRFLGVQPPDSANFVSLIFAVLTLILGSLMVLDLNLGDELKPYRVLLATLVLLGVVTNRTFLAWTSSGLETAMFNFVLTSWIFCAVFLPVCTKKWIFGIASSAVLAYLTRPDGLVIAAATLFLLFVAFYNMFAQSVLRRSHLISILPLSFIPLHLAWRRLTYGVWLPNTYYAKAVFGRIWPESGIRYFLSFVMEYSLWIWLILLLAVIFAKPIISRTQAKRILLLDIDLRKILLGPDKGLDLLSSDDGRSFRTGWLFISMAVSGILLWIFGHPFWGQCLIGLASLSFILLGVLSLSLIQFTVVLVLLAQFFYYTIVIGGDHFEFRVYSHLILLLFASSIWLLKSMKLHVKISFLIIIFFILFSWPIPWTHWAITHNLDTRETSGYLRASVAHVFQDGVSFVPDYVIKYLRVYDNLQFWLIDHAVSMRYQEHKIFSVFLEGLLPPRAEGLSLSSHDYPVIAAQSVGVLSWVLPRVNIIDTLGLNDYVIARNPELPQARLMAHARKPPAGYVECFSPNVEVMDRHVIVHPRKVPLAAEEIVSCERQYAQRVLQKSITQ